MHAFNVLVDPTTYPSWLVGAEEIRAVSDDWPAVGSRFNHVVGCGRSPSQTTAK